MVKINQKLLILVSFLAILYGCSVTEKLPEGEFYLKSNDYEFEGEKEFKSDLEDYVRQKPNDRAFGVLPISDWFYNEIPVGLDSVYDAYYSYDKSVRTTKLLDSLFVRYGQEQYVGKSKWMQRFFIYKNSEVPVVWSEDASEYAADNLEAFYFERGYFDTEIEPSYEIDTAAEKVKVTYNIEIGEPSDVVAYNQDIPNADMKRLYDESQEDSEIEVNERFDVRNFEAERSRLEKIYKNNGYYNFNSLGQELIFRVDSTDDKQLSATLKIEKNDSINPEFKKHYFNSINIFADNRDGEEIRYDTVHKDYNINSKWRLKFKPRVYTDALVIEKGQLYSEEKVNQTRQLIFDRDDFNLVKFEREYVEGSDSLLDVNIYFSRKSKYDLELFFEGAYSQFINFGVSPGAKLLSRNIFGGGEDWENSLQGTFGTVNNATDNNFFNAYEISYQTQLTFPRLLLPFNTEGLMPKHYNPKSYVKLGLSSQKNIGLGSRNYTTGLGYEITPGIQKHEFDLFHLTYVRNTEKDKYYRIFTNDREIRDTTYDAYFDYNPEAQTLYENQEINDEQLEGLIYLDQGFSDQINAVNDYNFEDYEDFRNMIFRKLSVTQDVLIQSFTYKFTYNENLDKDFHHPNYFYTYLEFAGLLPAAANSFANFKKQTLFNGEEVSMIGDVPYSQFIKIDLDARKTFKISPKTSFALRSFLGMSIPYGNSDFVPFSRAYFGGGSNDVRAWQAFELSPNPLRPNDDGTYIDNMKITWNAEYRFPIVGMFNGALFMDAGNIWSLNGDNPETQFKFDRFLSQMGIGTGFGFRIDLTYLVARFDLAYKMRDPAYPENDRWFRDFRILRPQLQFGLNYPF